MGGQVFFFIFTSLAPGATAVAPPACSHSTLYDLRHSFRFCPRLAPNLGTAPLAFCPDLPAGKVAPMKVMLADFDLFATTGGGQTFYRSIIESNPEVQFSYFSLFEPWNATRPANAQVIPFQERYTLDNWDGYGDVCPPRYFVPAFVRANNIAFSLIGHDFDVIDLPDYEPFGAFLRPALAHHRVKCDRIALSLHGRITTSIRLNWGGDGNVPRDIEALEDLQYQAVDLRYGLSRAYLDEWRTKCDLESHYFSPWRFLRPTTPSRSQHCDEPPDLQFIGRTEKCKGPDLFVEVAMWLPQSSYRNAFIVGPQAWGADGAGSNRRLQEMMANRGRENLVTLLPSANRCDLDRMFAARAVTILPSRYDTFNLVAMESLLAGCPTAIGSRAGVCRFLEQSLPDVPFIKIEMDQLHASIPQILAVLNDYDAYRDRLVDALQASHREPEGPALPDIYRSRTASIESARTELAEWYARLSRHRSRVAAGARQPHSPPARPAWKTAARRIARAMTTQEFRGWLRSEEGSPMGVSGLVQRLLLGDSQRLPIPTEHAAPQAETSLASYQAIHRLPEQTDAQLASKALEYGELITRIHADRVRLWREIARLESLRQNPLVAATYRLRAIRLAGVDLFHDVPWIAATLEEHGFAREANVADAMFGGHCDGDERCTHLLEQALQAQRRTQDYQYEMIDDRRGGQQRLASVIVSLYNAADKLPMFLRALNQQTIFASGRAEVILIDSGSPGNECAVFTQLAGELRIPVVYARSAQRETIQSAWNRGIALSRGKYLSFLGVDEAILPTTLETLAQELEADPTLDWVQANSIVTNVDAQGQWLNDVMSYDRTGYRQQLAYLDTCYLSWVGALYRRDIHERFGYYDASFGAAGDTEFKNRVLPFIKTKFLPQTLGVFWNYPSGQTTCSPRAEIEDLRAWYLHRTFAGVRYAFGRRTAAEAEELLYATLRYRKSYCKHSSTDVEYALNLARFLKEQQPGATADSMYNGLADLLGAYRALDFLPKANSHSLAWSTSRAWHVARRVENQHFHLSGERIRPAYQLFNDNRYEQHTQLWSKAA